MKFSLIICTYMRSTALLKLLKTVAIQSLYPDEILIIDGSTNDLTKEILEQHVFENLIYYKVFPEERGLTKQRNFGVDRIRTDIDIVCFLDDDTLLEKDYFEYLIGTYKTCPEALAVGGYITNEVEWKLSEEKHTNQFYYDGWARKESLRFKLRKKLGLLDNTPPGWMPKFSNGRSVSFLPPSDKVYPVEQIMGGVASYRKEVFKELSFSKYFEGYGLYEDADFSLRLAKKGKLYINTAAKLEHHHDVAGRPNQFNYGKMVTRNGWYVWRVKYKNPRIIARIKWNLIAIVLMLLRFVNIFTTKKKVEVFTETMGRCVGLVSLIFKKPRVQR
ncbi:glycosyltransferase family 2 protein [Polaribacter undariae]|uniref:Glycosyltransferase family 2 protein n=1 Tax=Polaribacter sejongensis TaxID=985043 RepID=A0AAJ1QVR5_9FLAO|nr:glycosyltransferase family 2 protein [Polaribacter undariae]MDN3618932.1 glycosyltransferase family 2 protein [Polaribacter undariae]UWD33021.1 glycosyltransferase [Polaribacter undariae]